MAELTTQERLQPSLLDRLTDRAPFRERVELAVRDEALTAAGMSAAEFRRLMEAHEFTVVEERPAAQPPSIVFESGTAGPGLRQLLDHVFRPRPGAAEVVVGDLVAVVHRQRVPNTSESRRDRVMSGKQLKESVLRDLGWLLNTGNLASVVSLDAYPRVRASVLNYGIPELAGVTASSADVDAVAAAIGEAITAFEPRLRRVRVAPRGADADAAGNTLGFLIEAELWGQPSSQHLLLHTELDLESAAATVRDADGGA